MATIDGTNGPDNLFDTAGNDTIFAMGGDDTVTVRLGQDSAFGDFGTDTLLIRYGGATQNTLVHGIMSFAYVDTGGGSFGTSTRRVDFSGFEHLDVRTGSGDDTLIGIANRADTLDGGAGTDLWHDNFNTGLNLIILMSQAASAGGLTLADGTTVRNVEQAEVFLGTGDDTFRDAGAFDDTVSGGVGDDDLGTSDGRDSFSGGTGENTLTISWSDAALNAEISDQFGLTSAFVWEGGPTFDSSARRVAWSGFTHLFAVTGAGRDTVFGLAGNDTLRSGGDDDSVFGQLGNDLILGGDGRDTLTGAHGMDTINGGAGSDLIDGGPQSDTLTGGDGLDTVWGRAGNDLMFGGADGDILRGGHNQDTLNGGIGNDTLVGGPHGDHLAGGPGIDWASYSDAGSGVWASMSHPAVNTGDAAGDSYTGIENLWGSRFADTLAGNNGDNLIVGERGADLLVGFDGNDTIRGDGANFQSSGDNDTLNGGAGDDLLDGRGGSDLLLGGNGDDSLTGGEGFDILDGGPGGDHLVGGLHSDVFRFSNIAHSPSGANRDVIAEFMPGAGNDKLDVSPIDANAGTPGNQAFTFIGAAAFSGVAGELRFVTGGGTGFVVGDVDGDSGGDITIQLNNVGALSVFDLIL